MLAVVAFLVLPVSAFAQGNGRGRGKPTDVFVNEHDARDGRWDKDKGQKNQNRDNDEWRRRNDNNGQYDRYGRGRNSDQYGGYGGYGSSQLRQTALNAGYNNGVQKAARSPLPLFCLSPCSKPVCENHARSATIKSARV